MNTLMNKLNKKKSGKKGFTLMEMLIVVAIIAILVAIMIPTFTNALTKAKISADEANLRAYYAECLSEHLLNDEPLPTKGADFKNDEVTVDGVTYKLQAGTYDIVNDTDNDTFHITYTPDGKEAVTIPGVGTTTDKVATGTQG